MREVWVGVVVQFEDAGMADAQIEAEVLLRHALGMDRARYFSSLNEPLSPSVVTTIESLVKRRLAGEPLAYITGRRAFYGLDFQVDKRVLVPRQETELLVDLALEAAQDLANHRVLVADVGTGSGVIAVAVAVNLPSALVYATDASNAALEVARTNASRHRVTEQIEFLEGDLLDLLPEPVDVIVSNPPYIPTGDLPTLPEEVQREPKAALDGGPDGLSVVRKLLRKAQYRLRPTGTLFMEMAPEQSEAVLRIARHIFRGARVEVTRDAMGNERALCVRMPG